MAKPFIAAFHAGDSTPDAHIDSESLTYWYRVTPRDINCDSTDTTMVQADNSSGNYFMGRPDGYQTLRDQVFVVPLLKSPATVSVNSGGTVYTFNAPAGASSFSVDFKLGTQSFALTRNGQTVLSGTSLKQISDQCPCGLYNFNSYVGTVPASARDSLEANGLRMFTNGLKTNCAAQPSLPASPPKTAVPTTTIPVDSGGTLTPSPTKTTTTTSTSTSTSHPGTGRSTIIFVVYATTFLGGRIQHSLQTAWSPLTWLSLENIYLLGSIPELQSWNPATALGPLPNPDYPYWTSKQASLKNRTCLLTTLLVSVDVPASTVVEYKYLRKNVTSVTWESGLNLSVMSPSSGQALTTKDTWR